MYQLEQIAYLKTDQEQQERIIIAYTVRPNNYIEYELACGTSTSWHCEVEISDKKDILKSIK